jgi:hypothetical protein
MDPAIGNFGVVVVQADLTGPKAPLKISELGRVLIVADGLPGRTH